MGEVWRAADEVLGRAVAVKLLLGDHADESATARFRLEAQTAARLSHPHLVAVFDFGAWEDRFYLVMELVEEEAWAICSRRRSGSPPSRSPGSRARRPRGSPPPIGRASCIVTSSPET